ncbi:MAG: hypothetical protein OEV23_00935 [Gallionella sp.]|nr:hypothetical protein [Gallionella sp.]
MNKRALVCAALFLAGCGAPPPRPLTVFDTPSTAPAADAGGWYTFGPTRFKGRVANGVPEGKGLCIDTKTDPRTTVPCTFSQGVRTDEKYLAARGRELEQRRAAEIADREERKEWAREAERAEERQRQRQREAEREYRAANPNPENPFAMKEYAAIANIHNQFVDDTNRIVKEKEAERRAQQAAEQERAREEREAKALRQNQEMARRQQLAQASEDQRRAQAEQQRREREEQQKQAQERAQQESAKQKQAQEQEQRRQQALKDKAERLAKEQAEKAAAKQAMNEYMAAMKGGIHLAAINCFGQTEVTGRLPKIKGDYCIDVYYRASCPGNPTAYSGIAKNFIGGSGCFGDTSTISPKPSCKAEDIRVDVTDVRPGCN